MMPYIWRLLAHRRYIIFKTNRGTVFSHDPRVPEKYKYTELYGHCLLPRLPLLALFNDSDVRGFRPNRDRQTLFAMTDTWHCTMSGSATAVSYVVGPQWYDFISFKKSVALECIKSTERTNQQTTLTKYTLRS